MAGPVCLIPQLPHSARQTHTEAEVPGPEEAGVSPVEALLRFQRCDPFSAAAVQPRINGVGPGQLWSERAPAGSCQAGFQ